MIMWNGTNDTTVSPRDTARYYEQVVGKMGQAVPTRTWSSSWLRASVTALAGPARITALLLFSRFGKSPGAASWNKSPQPVRWATPSTKTTADWLGAIQGIKKPSIGISRR